MTTRVLLLALCACNQAFDLKPSRIVDAPGPDAPFACPIPGQPFAFDRALHQVLQRDCTDVTIASNGHALMSCTDPVATNDSAVLLEGPLDQLAVPAGLDPTVLSAPRLFPDGDEALFVERTSSTTSVFATFRRGGGGAWTAAGSPLPGDPQNRDVASTVARGPRVLVLDTTGVVHEWTRDASGAWHEVLPAYKPADLGVISIQWLDLSSDGLRLVFLGAETGTPNAMYYASRVAVSARFAAAAPLEGVPAVATLTFITDDCARIYMSGLQRVFYAQQR